MKSLGVALEGLTDDECREIIERAVANGAVRFETFCGQDRGEAGQFFTNDCLHAGVSISGRTFITDHECCYEKITTLDEYRKEFPLPSDAPRERVYKQPRTSKGMLEHLRYECTRQNSMRSNKLHDRITQVLNAMERESMPARSPSQDLTQEEMDALLSSPEEDPNQDLYAANDEPQQWAPNLDAVAEVFTMSKPASPVKPRMALSLNPRGSTWIIAGEILAEFSDYTEALKYLDGDYVTAKDEPYDDTGIGAAVLEITQC